LKKLNEINIGNNNVELKEILQNLNETACEYLSENSIEKQFNQYSDNIIEKLDLVSNDLETKLSNKLKLKYNKYYVNNLVSQNVS
jgi:hypothetical protein